MSAWICSHEHIAAIVGTFLTVKDRYTEVTEPLTLARVLYAENMRSVDGRYGRHGSNNAEALSEFEAYWASHPVTALQIRRWEGKPLSLGQFFKALACYEYQACECEDWQQTEAFKLCDQMRRQASGRVDGYETCPWGIDHPPPLRINARRRI